MQPRWCGQRDKAAPLAMGESEFPLISVILARVSTEDADRVLETLAGFGPSIASGACEIVIVDRLQDCISARIERDYPLARLIPCCTDTTLPEMRTIAFEASRGAILAVTEDHCIPCADWVQTVSLAFAQSGPEVVAVGGSVVNGVTDTRLDWATFLCEYSSFLPPVAEGLSECLPGMNIAYRRSTLAAVPREQLAVGFWEVTLHPDLIRNGARFISLNELVMTHKKRISWRLFASQRFAYSRYYAGSRLRHAGLPKRVAVALTSLALPPVLLWRMAKAAKFKGSAGTFCAALPWLALFVVIWSLGESVGAMLGPGNALRRIE